MLVSLVLKALPKLRFILCCRFDPVVSSLKGLVPDGFIYLHASPETCMRRMSLRGRGEEGGVTMDYLSNLHTKHEEWLRQGTLRPEELALLSDPSRNLVGFQGPGINDYRCQTHLRKRLALPYACHNCAQDQQGSTDWTGSCAVHQYLCPVCEVDMRILENNQVCGVLSGV